MSKYDPLTKWLSAKAANGVNPVSSTFRQVEGILGFKLKPSARIHRQFWENNGKHPICKAWMSAGFKTDNVDLIKETLDFVL